MDHSVNILNELQAISPAVARIHRELPYQVPPGYFAGLASQVMEKIRAGSGEPVLSVLGQAKGNPYTVPAGYFDQLPDSLLQRIKASDSALTAEEELSVLSPLLSKLNKKLPFEAPAGYFTELTEHAVSGAKAIDFVNEELENLPSVLAGIRDKQVFEAPAGYFEGLPDQVLNRVKKEGIPAKVVSIHSGRKLMRYASAAAVIGLVVMAAWLFTGKQGTGPQDTVTAKVDKISEEELQSYLENTAVAMPVDLLASNNRPDLDASDMGDLLQNVSDEEIQKYLEQNLLTKQTGTN
jgi:hypothetical protein